MNVEVKNINGVRGFCVYKGGVPYTYIYTRDAIGMLGLSFVQNNHKRLRINRFGEYFETVMKDQIVYMQPVQIGINVSQNYSISQDNSACATSGTGEYTGASCCTGSINNYNNTFGTDAEGRYAFDSSGTGKEFSSCPIGGARNNPPTPPSKYDSILPEFILDRIIFAIANIMNSDIAKRFRYELFNTIIPHFQQTATQEQIAKVPILNQTTQFMYDNTNVQFTAQQAYNFNKNIVFQYVNRYAILTGQTDIMDVFERLFNDFEYSLNHAGNCVYDEIMKTVEARKAVNPYSPDYMTKEDILDTVICNLRMHNLFTTFVANYIRDKENELILKSNGQVVKEEWNQGTGYYEPEIEYEDKVRLHPVKFITMDERAGESPIQERSFADDYLPKQKRDTSWMY